MHPTEQDDDHDRGLAFDVSTLLNRRRALVLMAGAGLAVAVAGCSSGDDSNEALSAPSTTSGFTSSSTTTTATAGAATVSEQIPQETAGPFPGDGSNGPNLLTESGVVRQDIRSSFGSSTTTAEGVELTIELTVLDSSAGYTPLSGGAVYVWHCDREGRYSMYSQGATNENYLRGVQETGSDGRVTFTSIFPGAYSGRWPHIHFEVYPSLDQATTASNKIRTSQLALPDDACQLVFATDGYGQSVQNHAETSLDNDNVFRDGYTLELATVTGDVASGMVATLTLAV